MSKDRLRYITNEIFSFLTNKQFILNLLGIFLFLTIIIFGVFSWLRYYTHHGQKLELPDYVNEALASSVEDATARSFEIIVNDSVYIVGKEGGIIQNQNPPGGSLVKEERKVYVTITKYQADKVALTEMRFFGEEYTQVEAQLKRKSIFSKVKSYKFDPLAQNSVLEVWYNNQLIIDRRKKPKNLVVDKGDTLEFVVSSSEGGSSEVLDIINNSVSTARFKLQKSGLSLDIRYANDLGIDDVKNAIIIDQDPAPGIILPRGSSITVTVKEP